MQVSQCCVVPAGCTCQIAPRTHPLRLPPDVKHWLSLGFLHLYATSRCQVDSPFHPEGIPSHMHCLEPWQPCGSPAPVKGGWQVHLAEGSAVSGAPQVVQAVWTRRFASFTG